MIDDAKQVIQFALCVCLASEVDSPNSVARNGFWFFLFQVAAQDLHFIGMPLQGFVNVGFADGYLAGCGEAAVEDVGDGAASGLGHDGFETDDFLFEPVWLLRRVAMIAFIDGRDALAAEIRRGADPMQ